MADDRYIPYRENWNRQPDEIEQWLMNQRDRLQGGLSRAGRFARDFATDPLTYVPSQISRDAIGRGVMSIPDTVRNAANFYRRGGEAAYGVGKDIVGSFPNYPANYPGAEIANRPVMDMLRQYGPQAIGMLKEVFGPGEVIQGWPPKRAEFDTEMITDIEPIKVTKVKKKKKKGYTKKKQAGGEEVFTDGY